MSTISMTRAMALAAVVTLAGMAGSPASVAANQIVSPQINDVVTTHLPSAISLVHARLKAVAGAWEEHLKQLMHRRAVSTAATSVETDAVAQPQQGAVLRGDLPITPCSSGWFEARATGSSPDAC
jgi:hypothetical protein